MSSVATPKVSVIIPTYNCAPYVEDTITSVTSQTERDLEIIAVDDGSTDRTLEILKRLAGRDDRIFVRPRPNQGFPGCTRNCGLALARGEYIAFLDGDDLYAPERIRKVVSVFEAFPRVDVVFNDLVWFENQPDGPGTIGFLENARFLERAQNYLSRTDDFVYLCEDLYRFASLEFIPFHTSAITVKRTALFSEPHLFREDLRAGEDGELWFRLVKNYKFAFVNQPLSFYRRRRESITSDQVQYLLGAVQIHRENFERGRSLFSGSELQKYRAKIAELLFALGYAYFRRRSNKEARKAYKQSLACHFRAQTIYGYMKTFVPLSFVSKYRSLAY